MSILSLDSGTLALSAVVLTAASAVMAFVVARAQPAVAPVVRSWGCAMLATSTAFLFWFLGQELGGWAEFIVGNGAAVVGSVFFLRSAGLLVARPIPLPWLLAQLALGVSGILLVQFAGVPRAVAVVTIGLALLFAGLGSIVVIARNRDVRNSHWGRALMVVLAGWCVILVGARVHALFFGGGVEAVRPMAMTFDAEAALFAGTLMLMVVSKGGLAILADRLRRAAVESARRDGLTATLTRAAFFEEARKAIASSKPYAVLMLDVDHFKRVNDTYGHPGGDAVLRHVALQVLRLVRSVDLVGRYGGEEFCVLLPGCPEAEARRVATRICEQSARRAARLPDGRSASYTLSIGVATTWGTPQPETALERTIADADQALYRAKALGRNQVQVFSAGDPDAAAWAVPTAGSA